MSGFNLFVDTNIIIYLVQGDRSVAQMLHSKNLFASFITEIELLSFSKITARERATIKSLLADIRVIHSNPDITTEVLELIVRHRIKLPDDHSGNRPLYALAPADGRHCVATARPPADNSLRPARQVSFSSFLA
ncbi:MAG: PIN domain-containing protein [Cyclobacteriaceae bacterium]|jgi:hypothetical protein|nr:PIN domain-containing protein [Cyclobacteriaceae bacterium]